MEQVRKRDGKFVKYVPEKIFSCIKRASDDINKRMSKSKIYEVVEKVEEYFTNTKAPSVEKIQDVIEDTLIAMGYTDVYKAYSVYRSAHAKMRDASGDLMKQIDSIINLSGEDMDYKRSNANIQSDSVMGGMLIAGTTTMNYFHDNYLIPKEYVSAHRQGYFHIHDKDFLSLTFNCIQLDLQKLFDGGFKIGNGTIREPKSIRSAASLACIAIQSSQNDFFGGQAISDFDICMAKYVRVSFKKAFKNALLNLLDFNDVPAEDAQNLVDNIAEENYPSYNDDTNLTKITNIDAKIVKKAYKTACKQTQEETHQAMESVIFNLNSMHCLPASEKIIVVVDGEMQLISMEELNKNFKPNKYQVFSINPKTAEMELKYIVSSTKKNNHRRLITLRTRNGAKVTTTDNHKVMYLNNCDEIVENYPEKLPHVLMPRKFTFNVNCDVSLDKYLDKSVGNYTSTHIPVTEDFAKLCGYYVTEGYTKQYTSGSYVIAFNVNNEHEQEIIIKLVKQCFGDDVEYYSDYQEELNVYNLEFVVKKVIVDMFQDKFGNNARNKKIAKELLWANNDIKIAFLEGCFKHDTQQGVDYFVINTTSELLATQLQFLMLSLNECPYIDSRNNINSVSQKPYILYQLALGVNSINRLGISTDLNKNIDIKCDDFDFLSNLININKNSNKVHSVNKNYVDIETDLTCAKRVFPVTIKERVENNSQEEYVYDIEVEDNETFLTKDCIFVHNSRAGSQVPFSSLNFGTDTTEEARLVVRELLLAQEAGLGNGEISIFPITIFRLKEGINYNPGDKNYDLFKLACRVSSKRLYPNFESQDATFNMKYYDPNDYRTWISTMGALAGTEHLYVKINNGEPLDITIKDLFNYCKTGELTNARPCNIFFNQELVHNDNVISKPIKSDIEIVGGVYSITYIPEDITYIGSSSNVDKCWREYKSNIQSTGGLNDVTYFGDTNIDNYKFEVLEYTNDYQTKEKDYIENIQNINFKGAEQTSYKIPSFNTHIYERPTFKTDLNKKQDLIQLEDANIKVLDRNNKWVKVKHIFKNDAKNTPNMMHIIYKEHDKEFCLNCTEDHPLYVGNNKFVRADKLNIDDVIYRADGEPLVITDICWNTVPMDSYDIGTVTGSFIGSDIIMHNCRTRTISNVYDKNRQWTASRGNFAFVTINLPKLAIEANRDIKKFYKSLDKIMKLAKEQLLWRFELIGHRHAYNFPFMVGQHLYLDSEKLKPEDEIAPILKHASLSIGFAGLAETLVSLIGSHHGETEEARKLGYEIISYMRKTMDKYAEETGLNFSLFASPAESTCGRFSKLNQKQYGTIKGVTDRKYVTNSFHVPVYYPIKAAEKIKIEAPYHDLCNAGHISYVEYDGDPSKNVEAFEKIVRLMHDSNMGYYAINHKKDKCPNCLNTTIIPGDTCPICGYKEVYDEEKIDMPLDFLTSRKK